jgi:hypothetical protein
VARTRSLTALIAAAGAGCVVVAVIAGFAARHAWIERKIAGESRAKLHTRLE